MNRAARRRAGITGKPKTYVLNADQIRQIKEEARNEAFKMLLSIPMLVLHDKFQFDKTDMDRYVHYAMSWATDIQNGVVSLKEVLDLCEEETGLKIKEK